MESAEHGQAPPGLDPPTSLVSPADLAAGLFPQAHTGGATPLVPAADAAAAGELVHTFTASEQINLLAEGLAAAQLAYGEIERTLSADVQSRREGARSYQYDYAPLSVVLAAVRPALNRNGIAVLQPPVLRRSSIVVTTLLLHKSGQWIRNDFPFPLPSSSVDPQAIGSAITYLRRYTLQSILGVAPEDDDDGAAAGRPQAFVRQPERHSSGNGHGHAPTTGKANGHAVVTPPAVATPVLTLAQPIARRLTPASEAFWVAAFSDGRQAITFDAQMAGRLDTWQKEQRPIVTLQTHVKRHGKTDWTYIDEIVAAPGGAQ